MKTSKKLMDTYAMPIFGLIVTILLFAACKKNDIENTATPFPVAGVMAFNLASDKPVAGFTLSGNRLGSVFTYTGYTGTYLPVYSGPREVRAFDYNTGTTIAISSNSFQDSAYYSVFLLGANGNYRNVVVKDDVTSLTPATGKAWVRFINAIPDSSSTLNFTIGSTTQAAAYATVSGFVQVNAGSINTAVRNSSTIDASRSISIEENKIYTLLFSGLPGATNPEQAVKILYITNGIATQ